MGAALPCSIKHDLSIYLIRMCRPASQKNMFVCRSVLLLAVMSLSFNSARSQVNYQLEPVNSGVIVRPFDLSDGNTLYVCQRRFAWDSSYVSLLNVTPDHAVVNAITIRGNDPLTTLLDVDALDDGYVFCGSQLNAGFYAFITRVGADGAVEWSRSFNNIDGAGFEQNQIACIIPSGSSFVAYTSPNLYQGAGRSGSYRIVSDGSGASWEGQSIASPGNVRYKVVGGIAANMDEHTLYGSGQHLSNTYDHRLMVMRTTSLGASWMKFYDMRSSASLQHESVSSLSPISGERFLLAGLFTTGMTTFEGCLLELDNDGDLLWCRRYADSSGGLSIRSVVERPGGGLLAAAVDGADRITLLELQADGELLGAYQHQDAIGMAGFRQIFFTNGAGELMLVTADRVISFRSDGASCEFVPVSSVTSSLHTPTVTMHSMTNAPFTPSDTSLDAHSLSNDLSWAQTCVLNGIEERGNGSFPLAYPVPTDGMVHFGDGLVSRERVIVRDVLGGVRYDGQYGSGIDMRSLPPGTYTCEVPSRGWVFKVLRE